MILLQSLLKARFLRFVQDKKSTSVPVQERHRVLDYAKECSCYHKLKQLKEVASTMMVQMIGVRRLIISICHNKLWNLKAIMILLNFEGPHLHLLHAVNIARLKFFITVLLPPSLPSLRLFFSLI
ncbi:hypothetical protein Tco_0159432, partial [Tanacetum coccineum]